MTRKEYSFDVAQITEYHIGDDDSTGVVVCDNNTTSMSIPITKHFPIKPSCGDQIKYLIANGYGESKNILIVPIEIRIKNMRTPLPIDYDKIITDLELNLTDKKSWLPFSGLTSRERFIQGIDEMVKDYIAPYKKGNLY